MALRDCPIAVDAKISLDGKPCALSDLQQGMRLSLRFTPDAATVARIEASSSASNRVTVQAVTIEKRTVTVAIHGKDLTLPVAPDAKFYVEGVQGGGKLADVKVGMRVALRVNVVDGVLVVKGLVANP